MDGMMGELVSNPYCRVLFTPSSQLVRFIRTEQPIQSIEEANLYFGQAVRAIDGLGRGRLKLIIDVRNAPLRNDPQYESAMADYRHKLARHIPRVAVIARTAAGRLHAQRLGKEDHIQQAIVATEEEALAHLSS
jgi:hypothetical protein